MRRTDQMGEHKFGAESPLEEHAFMSAYLCGPGMALYVLPSSGDNPEFMRNACTMKEHHVKFLKRALARVIISHNAYDKKYVGCHLGFPSDPALFRKYFPNAKLIVCTRDPVEAVPSYANMCNTLLHSDFDDALCKRYEQYYEHFTKPIYNTFDKWDGDKDTIWVSFDDWKKNGVKVAEKIWQILDWKAPPGASQVALKKGETHKNNPKCFDVIPKERI